MDRKKTLDILAYYLSEYDMKAFHALGFETQSKGFDRLAACFGKKRNYLKRLRDEYDVVTNSVRRGQCNRPPRARIIETCNRLAAFSFEELTEIVAAFIENAAGTEETATTPGDDTAQALIEEELENILNFKDTSAAVRVKSGNNRIRIYNTAIIKQLKRLYAGKCQLCGTEAFPGFNVGLCFSAFRLFHHSLLSGSRTNSIYKFSYTMAGR